MNSANLDPNIGLLHEMHNYKTPLVNDLQEPFRCLVVLTILKALKRNIFHKNDFLRTDDYIIRIRPRGFEKIMTDLDKQFSRTVRYRGYSQQWNTVIDLKAQELAAYLSGKAKSLDLSSPVSNLFRFDSAELRDKILGLSYTEWGKMGFSKGTLHYMKKNARENKPFTLNQHVKERLNAIE